MRFRQVHLDFHTSEKIEGIGKSFDKAQFQAMLKQGHVDSITIFSKCHHGWSYHPTEVNEMHPHLEFDLLQAQIEAAHEIGVKTPVYISAGFDEKEARRHPEWLIHREDNGRNFTGSFLRPGYHHFCLNTPYLDKLIAEIEEVVSKYDADGIFLDIVSERVCYCHYCRAKVLDRGEDPRDIEVMQRLARETYANYTRRVREAIDRHKPGLPVFHNGGHIPHGRRDLATMNSHLELESLPTGGWGYDHFPLSARYAQGLGMDFLGMTGKFHKSWGEFGGFKHPNALRYETALSIANGARCSIGDQLHPSGKMNPATYRLIGEAYREVEQKEAWCSDVQSVADVALLSAESRGLRREGDKGKTTLSDNGACRILLEGKFLFDVIDEQMDFAKYKVIILPDRIRLDSSLQQKLEAFVQQGGKILATGQSGLSDTEDVFALSFGVRWVEVNPYRPDYFQPNFSIDHFDPTAFIFYSQGQKVELDGGEELGSRINPYFNRDMQHFCSHRHAPESGQTGGPGMVEGPAGIYIAWDVFEEYATEGSLILKNVVVHALNRLLGDRKTAETSLPAQGIQTLMDQTAKKRLVHHMLYAIPVRRGRSIEVIEDLPELRDVQVTLRVPEKQITNVYLAPQQQPLPYEVDEQGTITYTVPKLECHQMVVLDYKE